MTTVAVGHKLKKKGSLATDNPILGVLNTLMHCDDIHSVDLEETTLSMLMRVAINWNPLGDQESCHRE